jgi:hypothetical protein
MRRVLCRSRLSLRGELINAVYLRVWADIRIRRQPISVKYAVASTSMAIEGIGAAAAFFEK